MIQVTVYRKDNQIHAFQIKGHADSGPYGYDLVCAGVSAVTFGAVNAVMKLCDTDLEIEQAGEGGYLHVSIPSHLNNVELEKIQLLFESMVISLETIELEYSQFVTIQNK
ncbi:ribosomal-processing cysteine protease Prp [Virgibacillus sp. DJP39]|uniref:ribosomal-processing cysteine protease Prp n=1 Tax=Virgibacillus sp. DJP39 TaxID=3409790 RepID=UPI003BB758AE